MDTINIFDKNFITYSDSSTLGKAPRDFKYVKSKRNFDGITIFTDHFFGEALKVNSKYKVAWQVESPVHSKRQFDPMVASYADAFDMIFTFDESLIAKDPDKFKRANFGGTTVVDPRYDRSKKTKFMSIVHSGKTDTPNHTLRAKIAKTDGVDAFGRMTGTPFDNIADVLTPYKYSVIVENMNTDNYFSEKLTDCIACGCIPIYNGCTNVGKYFNTKGILEWRTVADLNKILAGLTPEKYASLMESHLENLKIVKDDYYTNEDWLYNKYLKELL